jgi:alanine-synthesizing transaminase
VSILSKIKPAKKYINEQEIRKSTFQREVEQIANRFEKSNQKWYRVTGADVVLTGNKNHAMSNYLIDAVKQGWDCYPTETNWEMEYLDAVCYYENKFYRSGYSPEDLVAIPGAASAWQLLNNAILNPGDELVAIEPSHFMTGPSSYLWYLGARVVSVPSLEDKEWEPDLDKLRAAITPNTRAISMVYPNNPTGSIYSAKSKKGIIDIAGEHEIPIISDELYRQITFDGHEASPMAVEAKDIPVITIMSFSKFFMKPGWRIGYVGFHDPTGQMEDLKNCVRSIAKMYGHQTSTIPLPILVASTRALKDYVDVHQAIADSLDVKGPMDESRAMVRNLQERRDYSVKRIREIEGFNVVNSKATLYLLPRVLNIDRWGDTEHFVLDLFRSTGVLFNVGDKFGPSAEGHIRTLVLSEINELEEIYNRVGEFMKSHSN